MSLIVNFFHIKSTNGLFYYGVDYISSGKDAIAKILVRRSIYNSAVKAFPNLNIVICSGMTLSIEIYLAALRGDSIYTPTPHPMPFISNQWIVVHDAYPFTVGRLSSLKKLLLKLSLATSSCRVAYINKSETLPFIHALGVKEDRCHFAPNKFPPLLNLPDQRVRLVGEAISIALVGNDSLKKNYSFLFECVLRAGAEKLFKFHVYGHKNAYLKNLCMQYPSIEIKLFESDKYSLPEFFSNVDLLVSVATQEGFGRPIASALLLEIPCFLLTRPVFKEFFDPGAVFFENEQELVEKLSQCYSTSLPRFSYLPPSHVVRAFTSAVTEIFTEAL